MLLPKSSCICISCVLICRSTGMSVPFLAFFGPNMKTDVGAVMYIYLKHSSDYIHS